MYPKPILTLHPTNRIITNSEDPVKMFENMASDLDLQLSVAIRAVLSKTIITTLARFFFFTESL